MRGAKENVAASVTTATNALMRRSRNRKTRSVVEQWNHNWRGWDDAAAIFSFPIEGDFDYLIRCVGHGRYTLESTSANAERAFRLPWSWCGRCREIIEQGHPHETVDEPSHLHVAELADVTADGVAS